MRAHALIAIAAALTVAATSARADPSEVALTAFARGDYLSAASDAEAEASPRAQVLAARALIAASMMQPRGRDVSAWLDRAEEAAEEALRLDPESVDARVQLAFTIGAKARRVSLAEAIARNYAPRGRHLIQDAIARAPNNAQAHALLGAWHLEVLRRGGTAGARMYRANLPAGVAAFDRARALAPNDKLIAIQYAIALLQLDPDRYSAQAAQLLTLGSATSANPLEAYAARQAEHILAVLRADGPQAARAASRRVFL